MFLNYKLGLQPDFALHRFWMQLPWNRYRYLPHETLHDYFASGNRTRLVKRKYRIRTVRRKPEVSRNEQGKTGNPGH